MVDSVVVTPSARVAMIRERQREFYGTTLRSLVHGLVEDYGVTQARLADVIGISPAMLSQLVSGQRIKIGNPVANTRLMMLADRRELVRRLGKPSRVDAVLADVARIQRPWQRPKGGGRPTATPAVADISGAATPQQLVAAAAQLEIEFPTLANALRQVAAEME